MNKANANKKWLAVKTLKVPAVSDLAAEVRASVEVFFFEKCVTSTHCFISN
jgi:hypothetical protein